MSDKPVGSQYLETGAGAKYPLAFSAFKSSGMILSGTGF